MTAPTGPYVGNIPLPNRLDPHAIEGPLYARAVERRTFHVPPETVGREGREPFVIVIPPPNVTSVLHMGHGLNNTIQDVLIRWRRMQGRAVVWVPGTDHAGIATQNVVERMLAGEGKTRFDVGREAFVDRVWEYVTETGGTILDQLKAVGASCDWERTRFTLDPGLSRAVREVFVRLHAKGLIYRGEYIINWCPRCLTALSNEEAEGAESEGRLHHLRYPLAAEALPAAEAASAVGADALERTSDGGWCLTVSTTRPETMLGDTGVAVHPSDPRYRELVGSRVLLPLAEREIPIVADGWVDPEFGSGIVKVTPAHDPNDFEIAGRTGLGMLDIFTPEARTNDAVPRPFRGLGRAEARRAVVEALKERGLYRGSEAHTHAVPHCYRCDAVVEPRLSKQWFVRMKPLAEPALAASREGTIRFHPNRWKKVYENWLEGVRDWCISRQLWWGHRIPVWYCRAGGCGATMVLAEDPEACSQCGSREIEQDPDVLDTWFSSWLWPFSVFGWPEETDDLAAFYPGHVLVTGPDILFFWVARMIMSGYEFMGKAPYTDVFLNGMVLDAKGRKMSKSLGNGIDPLTVVDRFGADALRFTVLSMCGVGADVHLDHEDLEATFAPGRNFSNKLWNAGRFTLMAVGDGPVSDIRAVAGDLEVSDRWILSRLAETAGQMTEGLEKFRLHDVVDRAYHFFWGDFADWYLELSKTRLRGGAGEESREVARAVLIHVFDRILRLLHPLIPFVTEHLWDRIPWPEGRTRPEGLALAPWPRGRKQWRDPEAESAIRRFRELVGAVRRLRKEYGVREGVRVRLVLGGLTRERRTEVRTQAAWLDQLARVSGIGFGAGRGVGASTVLRDGTEVFLPLEGLVDLERERARLLREIERIAGQVERAETKLGNPNFVGRAPEAVVLREREKLAAFRGQREKLAEKLAVLGKP